MAEKLNRLSPITLSLLRIVAGFDFSLRGVDKLFGWFGGDPAPLLSPVWFSGAMESLGGPLILLSLITRPVSLLLGAEMLLSYLLINAPQGFWPLRNGGEMALLFLIAFLVLITSGPGRLSLDKLVFGPSRLDGVLEKFSSPAQIVFRVMTGVLFWQHGASKFGMLGGRVIEFPDLRWFAGVLEFFGGPLIALGIFTRPVAFLLSGEMAYAFWGSHVPRGSSVLPIVNGGEFSSLYCFFYLYLVTVGPGWLSLDQLLFRKSSKS